MKTKKLIALLCFTGMFPVLQAQNLVHTPTVTGVPGGSGTSSALHADWSVGEPVIPTFSSPGLIITQGFEQPQDFYTGIHEENTISNNELLVYPSPTSGEISLLIKMDNPGRLSCRIYDDAGRLIEETGFSCTGFIQEQKLSLFSVPSGNYMMEAIFTDKNNSPRKTHFKIQKIN